MVNQELVNYIKKTEHMGYNKKQIRNYIIKEGYKPEDVDEAMKYANQNNSQNTKKNVQTNKATGIKKRNPFLVIFFSIITLGIYSIFWLISTTKELRKNTNSAPNPSRIWLFFIPIYGIIAAIKYYIDYSKSINELTGYNKTILIILWIFLGGVAMIISQLQLNKKA